MLFKQLLIKKMHTYQLQHNKEIIDILPTFTLTKPTFIEEVQYQDMDYNNHRMQCHWQKNTSGVGGLFQANHNFQNMFWF